MSELRDVIAAIITNTNQPDRYRSLGRSERERRLKEADAILEYLCENDYVVGGVCAK